MNTNNSAFLPADYEIPTESKYMSFEEGKNKFRILAGFQDEGTKKAIMGSEYWKTVDGKRKPIRKTLDTPIPSSELEFNTTTGETEKVKHFWAIPVYNYQDKKIQILEITQKTIQNGIRGLSQEEDWGNPKDYDITVTRSDDSGKTAYTVTPSPKKSLDKEIVNEFESMDLDLTKLYEGGDPFGGNGSSEPQPVEGEPAIDDLEFKD